MKSVFFSYDYLIHTIEYFCNLVKVIEIVFYEDGLVIYYK